MQWGSFLKLFFPYFSMWNYYLQMNSITQNSPACRAVWVHGLPQSNLTLARELCASRKTACCTGNPQHEMLSLHCLHRKSSSFLYKLWNAKSDLFSWRFSCLNPCLRGIHTGINITILIVLRIGCPINTSQFHFCLTLSAAIYLTVWNPVILAVSWGLWKFKVIYFVSGGFLLPVVISVKFLLVPGVLTNAQSHPIIAS